MFKEIDNNIIFNDKIYNPFSGFKVAKVVAITQPQEEIWSACKFGGDDANRAYNESISLDFQGELDTTLLISSIKVLIKRHESLRSVFSANGRFIIIYEDIDIDINIVDISNLLYDAREDKLKAHVNEDAEYIFDLIKGPLCKFTILKTAPNAHRIIITCHHIICDGWSIGIIMQDLGKLYTNLSNNEEGNIEQPISFGDYADELLDFRETADYRAIEKFWLNLYSGDIPRLELPVDNPYPELRSYKANRLDFKFDNLLLSKLKQLGQTVNCSLVTTLLAVYDVFIYRITNQKDLVVGLPSAGQSATGMYQLIGHCVNLLPIRTKIDSKLSFQEYLRQKNSFLLDIFDNQQLSFGTLIKKLAIARDPSRVALVPVTFNIDLGLVEGVKFHDLDYKLTSNPRNYEIFEIFVNVFGSENDLVFEWSYNTSIFKAETITRFMSVFNELARELVALPDKSIEDIVLHKKQGDYAISNSSQYVYQAKPLHELLQIQALKTPNNTAIEFFEDRFTYKELNERSNQLAQYFNTLGIGSRDFIGVSLKRGPDLVATLIAIMQCGAAYVPLDPDYPINRIKFMLKDSQSKFLISNKDNLIDLSIECTQLFLEDILDDLPKYPVNALNLNINSNSLAYLLYTSGSTGKPKGVPISHKNLVNLFSSLAKQPGMQENDRQLAITTISFDISNVEMFLPLLHGATVVMVDATTARNGKALLEVIKTKNISILQATPTTWKILLESNWTEKFNLKAQCGGEALSKELSLKILEKCSELWNMYGPTETTIYSHIKKISSDDDIITIGKPISNCGSYILSPQKELLPQGIIGEIAISGDGVAEGYFNRSDLTEDKFIDFSYTNNKLYLTGDLGKMLPNGEILCLGREDNQIKVRGYRIEVEEIEHVLNQHQEILSCAIIGKDDNLIAFLKLKDDFDDQNNLIDKLKANLSLELPSYYIPHNYIIIDDFPKTPNNKLDRKALLQLGGKKVVTNISLSNVSETQLQKDIKEIWKRYLDLEDININSNFFELGGHSLKALQVMNAIENELNIENLPISSLFEYSSISKLADLIDNFNKEKVKISSLIPIKTSGSKPPLYLIHGAGLELLIFNPLVEHLDKDQPVYGLRAPELLEGQNLFKSIEALAANYVDTIIKSNSHDNFSIVGYSFGGIIAFEMARLLKKQNKTITMLGLVDTFIEPHFYFKTDEEKFKATDNYIRERRQFYTKDMFKSITNFMRHIKRKKDFIVRYKLNKQNFKTTDEELKHNQFLKTEAVIQPLRAKYCIKPLEINVDFFNIKEDFTFIEKTKLDSWRDFAKKGLVVHDIPGNHDNLFEPAQVADFAKIFQKVLHERNISPS
ncbi:MAG: amino acid adenylation domain-containing protein [Jejuia sp.]